MEIGRLTFASVIKNPIYKNRDVLYSLVPPNGLVRRDEQKNELVMELAPILMNSAVSSIFLFGNPGTGKTSIIFELIDELKKEARKQKTPVSIAYVNCSENRTETTILIEVINHLNKTRKIPRIGWTKAKALSEFINLLDKRKTNLLVVLDEIDYTLKESGDDILYTLSRINTKVKSNVSTILISNDIRIQDYLKPRTQSTVGRIKIIFSPYTSDELFEILSHRVKFAFNKGVISDNVLKKIAEIEATRDGDARRALELLDSCAKVAVSRSLSKITLDIVDDADGMLEKDTILTRTSTLTKHQKILMLAMLKMGSKNLTGGKVYRKYIETCSKHNVVPLSNRSIRTFLVNFDETGLIDSEVTWSKELGKKIRLIKLNMDTATAKKARKMIRDSI